MLYAYVDYGEPLPVECGYDLQYFLTHFRGNQEHYPKCIPCKPFIEETMLNAFLYVLPDDKWKSGIVDATRIGEPRVIASWDSTNKSPNKGIYLKRRRYRDFERRR
jgi:hypothetical protein